MRYSKKAAQKPHYRTPVYFRNKSYAAVQLKLKVKRKKS